MAVAVSTARDAEGRPRFLVVGVDLASERGRARIAALNEGRFPFVCSDAKIAAAISEASDVGNLRATDDPAALGLAETIVVDVNLDLEGGAEDPSVDASALREAVRAVGRHMRSDALVVVETTVPPGTCERVVAPLLREELAARGYGPASLLLAHSYERVMPGPEYLDSIINYWRCYAGLTPPAADACEMFLSRVINVGDYPLTRLSSVTASETAKIVENSYRALNIAFMEEWGSFAETIGVDMYEITDAIRRRSTHANIRQPGFGVGGYCLTKDPLLGLVSARELYQRNDVDLPLSRAAVRTNAGMPLRSLSRLEECLGGLRGRTIALLGIAYRSQVADTRCSPAETFYRAAARRGAALIPQDPYVEWWPELAVPVSGELPAPGDLDAVVLAVRHPEYRKIDPRSWLAGARPVILDASDVLTPKQRHSFRRAGCLVKNVGRPDDS